MEVGNTKFVVIQYTWKGDFSGYVVQQGNATMFVPNCNGNRHFRELRKRIEEKKCEVRAPNFQFYSEVFSPNGKLTGHDTGVGFVPIDSENALRKLLQNAITLGTVKKKEAINRTLPYCSHAKFCISFPKPWPGLKERIEADWPYRPKSGAAPISTFVKLSNQELTKSNVTASVLERFVAPSMDQFKGLQTSTCFSVLEIEFNIRDLNKIYKSEKTIGFGADHDFIEDQIHLAKTRDARLRDSPSTESLIFLAPSFLSRAVLDIANSVAREFNVYFGGAHVGFLVERDLQERAIWFLRDDMDKHHVLRITQQPSRTIEQNGKWETRTKKFLSDTGSLPAEAVQSRLKHLIECGFAPEALSVANGYFEILFRQLLGSWFDHEPNAKQLVLSGTKFGYSKVKQIVEGALKLADDRWPANELGKVVFKLDDIYKKRNEYMHLLKIEDFGLDQNVDQGRQVNELLSNILDYFEANRFSSAYLEAFNSGPSCLGSGAEAFIKEQIAKLPKP